MKRYDKIITKNFLIKEYIIRKKSMKEIAMNIGCSNVTIFKRLKKYKIKTRDCHLLRKSKYDKLLTKEFLKKEYSINKNSASKIAKLCKCNRYAIFRHLRKYNIPINTVSEYILFDSYSYKKLKKIYECNICGKKVSSKHTKICQSCYISKLKISRNTPSYIDGRSRKLTHCMDCDKLINWQSKRCRKCAGIYHSEHSRGMNNANFGKKLSLKQRMFISKMNSGKNNGMWKDGTGRLPYAFDFSRKLKEEVRKRDDYICQNCSMTEEEHLIIYGRNLHVHHIDYDKNNSKRENLVTLCFQCNIRANCSRDYWKNLYDIKIRSMMNLEKKEATL